MKKRTLEFKPLQRALQYADRNALKLRWEDWDTVAGRAWLVGRAWLAGHKAGLRDAAKKARKKKVRR